MSLIWGHIRGNIRGVQIDDNFLDFYKKLHLSLSELCIEIES